MRRRKERRRDGIYLEVPAAGDLTLWANAVMRNSDLGDEERRVAQGIAHLMRRAIIVDGAAPGDRVFIAVDDLCRVS